MPFPRAHAAETLRTVAGILAQERGGVSGTVSGQIEAAVREFAPRIAAPGMTRQMRGPIGYAPELPAPAAWVGDPVLGLLEVFWSLRGQLSARARQALESAWQPTEGPAMRDTGRVSISEPQRQAILDSLRQIADYRVFVDPPALQAEVSALIRAHRDRLREDERKAWLAAEELFKTGRSAEAYLRWVEARLAGYPMVRRLLERGKGDAPRPQPKGPLPRPVRGGPIRPDGEAFGHRYGAREIGAAPAETASERTVRSTTPVPQATVDRYGNVYFPEQVMVGQRLPLIIHVARQPSTAAGQRIESAKARMSLAVAPLTLVLSAEGFRTDDYVIGGEPAYERAGARIVEVDETEDCDPVIFFLTAESAGPKKLSVDIYQFERNIRTLAFTVEVVGAGADFTRLGNVVYDSTIPVISASAGEAAPPPDLELRVMLSGDRRTLIYTLHSPTSDAYNFQPAGQVSLTSEPREYFRPKYDRLSDLAKLLKEDRSDAETAAARQEIENLGVELYNELFSPELKEAYHDIREAYAGKALLITTDDPWVPWELVRPFEMDRRGRVIFDDRPLCERFRVSRWLAGRGAPDRVAMKRGVWIAPPSNLNEVQAEKQYFEALHQREWEITLEGPLERAPQVEAEFQAGRAELFHFSCHGGFDDTHPDEAALELADQQYLRPSAIVGLNQAGLLRARPVVFLNACHGGRVEIALTRLGGWAQRFLDSGASAFIGSQWEINDRLAAQFAQEFYDRLWGLAAFEGRQQPIGQAFHEARLAIRDADPANPTWLAYVLYGDPYGSVILGG